MKVKLKNYFFNLTLGRVYKVISYNDHGHFECYRIINDNGKEDYCHKSYFDIVDESISDHAIDYKNRTKGDARILKVTRSIAWEHVKAELYSMLHTFYGEDTRTNGSDQYDDLDELITTFIQEVEESMLFF